MMADVQMFIVIPYTLKLSVEHSFKKGINILSMGIPN